MRTLVAAFSACLLVLIAYGANGRAALDAAPPRTPVLEVLVFEHPDCTYCRIFRRDVLPRYRRGGAVEHVVPLRFVDIAKSDTAGLGLQRRIDTVPTAVVMRDGVEIDRIVGYWGPDNFFKMLAHILARAE
jgi:thioredoxin-related protein